MIFYLLVLLAVHRIWHYEDIFSGLRGLLALVQHRLGAAGSILKPITCPACSPVWIGLGLAVGWPWIPESVVWTFSAYPIIRMAVAVYLHAPKFIPTPEDRLKSLVAGVKQGLESQRPPAPAWMQEADAQKAAWEAHAQEQALPKEEACCGQAPDPNRGEDDTKVLPAIKPE